jgi:hypothetical protein
MKIVVLKRKSQSVKLQKIKSVKTRRKLQMKMRIARRKMLMMKLQRAKLPTVDIPRTKTQSTIQAPSHQPRLEAPITSLFHSTNLIKEAEIARELEVIGPDDELFPLSSDSGSRHEVSRLSAKNSEESGENEDPEEEDTSKSTVLILRRFPSSGLNCYIHMGANPDFLHFSRARLRRGL